MAAGVDAAHELLAEEAALGERHRVLLEERLLRDRRLVDVDRLQRDALLDAPRLERHRLDDVVVGQLFPRPDQVVAPAGGNHVDTVRGVRCGRAGAGDVGEHAEVAGAVDDLGVDADLEPIERCGQLRAEAGIAVEPGVVTDTDEAEVDVELPLRRQQQAVHRVAVGHRVEVGRHQRLEEGERVGAADHDEAAVGAVHPRVAGAQRGEVLGQGLTHAPTSRSPSGARRRAAAAAVSSARALLWHSRSSSAGTESATMPAPACTLA